MSGNGRLNEIGIGPDLLILPNAIHWFIAVQGAAVAWFFFHLAGACAAYGAVAAARNKTIDASESRRLAKEAARSLVDAVVEPFFVLLSYIVQLISFLVSNAGRVVLVVFGCAMAYVVVNYQQQLIVTIDSTYETLYPAFVVPLRRVLDGAVLLYDLWVALHNALHQFLYEFLWNFFKHTLACQGYFSNFFDILGALAQAIASAVVAVANWLNADLVGQLNLTPAIAQLRLAAYDLLLRVDCACEGNRGLVNVATIGLVNDQSTVVDLTLNYGINSLLSIPQVVLASIVASTRTNTYDPPDSDYVINQFEGFVSNLGPLLNQLTFNVVTFIENLLNLDDFGIGTINWTPPPLWSIPQQLAMVLLEGLRIVARCVLNINDFFVFGQPQRVRKYALLDATQLFVQANILPDTVFIQNFAVLVPKNVLLPWSKALSAFAKVPIAALQVAYELVERVLVGWSVPPGYVANTNGQPNVFNTALFPQCVVNTQDEQEVFENIWASLWDTATRVNLFVNAVDGATSALGDAVAPYYPPVSPLIQFGANWLIEIYYTLFLKGAYLINTVVQFQPPAWQCIESFGRTARVSGDNFVLAIPDFFTFFLDIKQAQQAENAHIICKDHNAHNFIYAGGLKAYFFASEISNIFYLDGTPVSCTFYNSYLCPEYTLAYADINNNALCNLGDTLSQAFINTLTTARITTGFMEQKVVSILACLIDPGNPSVCSGTTSGFQQDVVLLGKTLNDQQTLVVKTINTFVSVLSPVFDIVYQSYFGPNSALSGAQANQAYNEGLNPPAGDLLTYVSIRHGPNSCGGASNAEACAGMGEHCEWMGAKGGGCQVNTQTHLAFQKYPLEAAFATLLISVTDTAVFWPGYIAFLNAQRLANAFAFSDFSQAGIANLLGRIFANMQEDQYFVILTTIRVTTLAIRDVIMGLVEFIRAFIFTLSRGVLPSQFVAFEKAMVELINFAEELIALLVNEGFTMLLQFGYILQDFMGIVADPQNLVSYTVDMFERIMNILLDAIQFFETLILNLPGIKDLCPLIKLILEDILKPLVAPILNAIVDGINIIIGILDYLFGAGIAKIPNLNIPQSVVCNPQGQAPRPYEATPCSTISDCAGGSTYCYISHPNECAEGTGQGQWNYVVDGGYRPAEEWAQPCLCSQTKGGDFFCNYASGFCQYGISYFGDPLMTCPVGTPADLQSSLQTVSSNPFGEDTPYYNAMCWLLPVYECQPANNGVLSTQQMQACIQGMINAQKVQGPYLCRDFCNPSPFNTDNQLYQDSTFGCVCLIGVGVGMGTGAPPYVPAFSTIGHRRALLDSATGGVAFGAYTNATIESIEYVERYVSGTFYSSALPSAGGPTHCSTTSQCEAPEAVCRRHDGSLGPCEACPLRYSVEDFTGFTCASAKCLCVSPPPPGNPGVASVDWVGFSKCAIVGRAYQNRTDLSALEYVTLRDCTKLHRFGQFLGIVTGVPLDPAVAYDAGAAALAVSHLMGGVIVANVYPDADDAALRNHMRAAGVDPTLYMGFRKPTLTALRRVADEFPRAADLVKTTARAGFKFAQTVNAAPRAADLRLAFTMAADGARVAAETAASAARRVANATIHAPGVGAGDARAAAGIPLSSNATERTQAFFRDAAADAAAFVVSGERMRATARRLQSLPPTTCWVLSEARSVAIDTIANIKNQYVYNGARAVCIFLQRSNCPQRYEDYYKATTPSPPPPPNPPPYRAPPPKPPAAPPAVVPAYPHLKTLQGVILSGVGGLAGVDLSGALNTWVQKFLTFSPANPVVVQQSLTEVTRVLQCDYNASPFCLKRKMTLIEGVLRLGLGVIIVNLGLKFLGLDLTLIANVFMSVFFVPVLFKIVYDMPFGCTLLPPFIFPVCLLDDVLPLFNILFARHIAWPSALLVSGARTTVTIPNAFGAAKTATTLTKDQIVDCVAKTQLYDGVRYILWALEAYVPMWRRKVPLVTTLLSTQSSMYNLITMYQGIPHATLTDPVYKACAGTMFPVLFPTLALIVLFLVFGIGIIHIVLVILKHLFRALASGVESLTSYFETAKDDLEEDDEDEDDSNENEKAT